MTPNISGPGLRSKAQIIITSQMLKQVTSYVSLLRMQEKVSPSGFFAQLPTLRQAQMNFLKCLIFKGICELLAFIPETQQYSP